MLVYQVVHRELTKLSLTLDFHMQVTYTQYVKLHSAHTHTVRHVCADPVSDNAWDNPLSLRQLFWFVKKVRCVAAERQAV